MSKQGLRKCDKELRLYGRIPLFDEIPRFEVSFRQIPRIHRPFFPLAPVTQARCVDPSLLFFRFEKNDILRIVRALAIVRPSLIALQMPLSEEDEVFVEKCFQRSLLVSDLCGPVALFSLG